MKIDWMMVIAFVIGAAIFKLLDRVVLNGLVEKIGGQFEMLTV